jgi:galactokinase
MSNANTRINSDDRRAFDAIIAAARTTGLDVSGAKVRRTSSRFCLGVEHGDYNGSELFGAGVDRFIWFAYNPNSSGRVRLFSANFPDDGVVEFQIGSEPDPKTGRVPKTWAKFPLGVSHTLAKNNFKLKTGMDGIIFGNIPGGGMSRSASLTINLILSFLDANGIPAPGGFQTADLARSVENDYVGSPCGELDQVMILFAKEGMGVHYKPRSREVVYIPIPPNAPEFRLMVLDTGTERPGLENSTYVKRRAECENLLSIINGAGFKVANLADVDAETFAAVSKLPAVRSSGLFKRLKYIFDATRRFPEMLDAWRTGDMAKVGGIFRQDGIGLRNDYEISGPELDAMCDIVRPIPGVLGERMLGGGDKGAAGAIVEAGVAAKVIRTVSKNYIKPFPALAGKFSAYALTTVDGIKSYDNISELEE